MESLNISHLWLRFRSDWLTSLGYILGKSNTVLKNSSIAWGVHLMVTQELSVSFIPSFMAKTNVEDKAP